MFLTFREDFIGVQPWGDRNALKAFLSRSTKRHLWFEPEDESGHEFHSVVIYRNKRHSEVQDFGAGICSQGSGLKPHLLLLPEKGTLILGFNNEAVGVSLETGQVCFNLSFDYSPFYSFIHLSELRMVLALHEIGVVTIDEDGEKVWEYDGGDVITSAEVVGERLHLEFMDSPTVILKLIDGTGVDSVE